MAEISPQARHDRVVAFLAALDKAISGVKLYQGKGDLVDRMFADLGTSTTAMVDEGEITVRLSPVGVSFNGEAVTDEERKPPYFLRLFRDGVREMTLFNGIELDELKGLVDVLSRDLRAGSEDLVTLLWNKELQHLRYYAVDSFTATVDGRSAGEAAFSGGGGQLAQSATATERVTLAPDNLRILKADGALDWVRSVRAPVERAAPSPQIELIQQAMRATDSIGRVVDIAVRFAAREDPNVASPLLLGAFDSVVDAQRIDSVTGLLGRAAELATAQGAVTPEQTAARSLLSALLDAERMARLAPLFRDQPDPFLPVLKRFAEFESRAEAPADGGQERTVDRQLLVPLLLEVGPGPAQDKLQDILKAGGIDLTAFYRSRLGDPNEEVVADAIRSLGKVGSKEAVEALTKALGSVLKKVRRAALEAMQGNYQEEARIYLGRILKDPSPENRLLALAVLQSSGDPRAAGLILSTVQDAQFANRDAEEHRAFMLALAAFQDNRTIEFFEKTLQEKNLTRSEAIAQRQKLAAEALAKMGTDKARATLEAMKDRWYHPKAVKDAVHNALRTK